MPASIRDRLIIFSRYPRVGTTKTRMIPVMGAEGAAALQRRMTEHTLSTAVDLSKKHPVQIEIHFEGGDQDRMQKWLGPDLAYRPQASGDIGARMQHALAEAFAEGADRAILIGTDIPEITAEILKKAYGSLDKSDIVFGPAADGGYYLIGTGAQSFQRIEKTIFRAIEWGSRHVLEQTLATAGAAGASFQLVETLTDVDRPADLPIWTGRARSDASRTPQPIISVIIPTLNEADHIGRTLAAISGQPEIEIIVMDSGSSDGTHQIAIEQGATVYRTKPSKAGQMNAGAALARGEILLFLHADTILPQNFGRHVRKILEQANISAGAFRLGIDAPGSRLRFIEKVANIRSRFLRMPYGDQAIFMTARAFGAIGGYPDQPIMEDFELIRRLQRRGQIAIAPEAVRTSPRRWLRMGVLRTWLINQSIVVAYLAGAPPERLAHWYRREKGRQISAADAGPGE